MNSGNLLPRKGENSDRHFGLNGLKYEGVRFDKRANLRVKGTQTDHLSGRLCGACFETWCFLISRRRNFCAAFITLCSNNRIQSGEYLDAYLVFEYSLPWFHYTVLQIMVKRVSVCLLHCEKNGNGINTHTWL